jgi:hypothetical protein
VGNHPHFIFTTEQGVAMAVKKQVPQVFVDESTDEDGEDSAVIEEPVVVMAKDSDVVSARVKGTWKMYWGTQSFDFVDGKRYNLPKELFAYLRNSGNIYDTL